MAITNKHRDIYYHNTNLNIKQLTNGTDLEYYS